MASASDVPGKFDCVINGQGYMFVEGEDTRAQYGYSPTFIERQNVGSEYGDEQQDFFLTTMQKDWSLGEERKYADVTDSTISRRYWAGTSVDPVTVAGQVSMRNTMASVSFGEAVIAAVAHPANATVFAAGATHLYEVAADGTVTDRGAHGQGGTLCEYSLSCDGKNIFIGTTSGAGNHLRKWNGSAFSDYSGFGFGDKVTSTTLLANTFYGYLEADGKLAELGAGTNIYTWKDAEGTALTGSGYRSKVLTSGGSLIILRRGGINRPAELWTYNGSATFQVAEFPANFTIGDMVIIGGIPYISGYLSRNADKQPAIYYFLNGNIGQLWVSKSSGYTNATWPGVVAWQNGVAFTDDTQGKLMFYDIATGGVHSMASYTVTNATPVLAATKDFILHIRNGTTGWRYPTSTVASSSTVTTSLFDYGNTLNKQFRGIKVDADIPSGASIDLAYQADSVDGAFTTLQTGAASGTEYALTGVSGHSLSVKVTLNKGSSTSGPVLKRIYVRGAPFLQQFRQFTFVLDCTGRNGKSNIKLRNGAPQPFDGQTMAANLVTAITATTPISVTDRFGSYTAMLEPDKCQLREVRPEEYIAVISGRQV